MVEYPGELTKKEGKLIYVQWIELEESRCYL